MINFTPRPLSPPRKEPHTHNNKKTVMKSVIVANEFPFITTDETKCWVEGNNKERSFVNCGNFYSMARGPQLGNH